MSKKDIKSRRFIIAMVFYLVAMGLALVECAIKDIEIAFYFVIGGPIIYPIYYCLISTFLEEYKIWPLVVILGICLLMGFGRSNTNDVAEVICEIGQKYKEKVAI